MFRVLAIVVPVGVACICLFRLGRKRISLLHLEPQLPSSEAKSTSTPPRARLAVLNPRGNGYNDAVLLMLEELFESVNAALALVEVDISDFRSEDEFRELAGFDGFIVPGSPASVAAGSYNRSVAPMWMKPLEKFVRQLHAKRIPMFGICFGHQILATSMGGRVETNSQGLQAAACAFDVTPLGKHVLGFAGVTQRVKILYHHNDIVTRPCGVSGACRP